MPTMSLGSAPSSWQRLSPFHRETMDLVSSFFWPNIPSLIGINVPIYLILKNFMEVFTNPCHHDPLRKSPLVSLVIRKLPKPGHRSLRLEAKRALKITRNSAELIQVPSSFMGFIVSLITSLIHNIHICMRSCSDERSCPIILFWAEPITVLASQRAITFLSLIQISEPTIPLYRSYAFFC
jgi:hypothetical protein